MLKHISAKLILAVGITAMLIIGVYSYFNVQSQSEVLIAEIERNANQFSETVKSGTRYGMLLNQRDNIHHIIKTIGSQPGIREVRVLNKDGEIIYSSLEEDIGQMVDKNAESCYACHAEDQALERLTIEERTRIFQLHGDSVRVLGIINPIYNESICWEADCHVHSSDQTVLGILDVTLDLGEADAQIRLAKIKLVVFAVCAMVAISLIIGFFVRRWIDRPVRELVKATDNVASGNLNYTIQSGSRDELGRLADSFNHMTGKLSEMRQQLFQSDKMASLGRLAAGVAHEINNPLTGVLTYSSYLQKRTKDQPEIQNDLSVIVRETMRSREIVKGLLDFARQSTPQKSCADINEIIERSIKVVQNQLRLNRINLEKALSTGLPQVTLDANQIQQVFLNLLLNAIDAIGPGDGTIKISSSLLSLSPFGIMQIKNATCPENHSLMDESHRIEGMTSIKLIVRANGDEGYLYRDPVYGKNRDQYGIPLSRGKTVRLSCPRCGISLLDPKERCPDCGAPVYRIPVYRLGEIEGCTRYGCRWQRWKAIDSEGEQQYVEVRIEDSGCGIDKENLDKIFDPFYTTKGQKGTGLGLSVTWGVIDSHYGSIKVSSTKGKGTVFTIRLPLKRESLSSESPVDCHKGTLHHESGV